MKNWSNWSGSLVFNAREYYEPESEDELMEIFRSTQSKNRKLRLAAAGHSSSPLVETPDVLVHLGKMKALISMDRDKRTATFQAGIKVQEANHELQKLGFALFNTGDVDVQTLAGAIATGTHGSGKRLQNLASMLKGCRMITSSGEVASFTDQADFDLMRALRVSLGALGLFTAITVDIVPLFKLHRREFFTSTDECVQHFDMLCAENRNADFYWYPRRDDVKIRLLNEPGQGSETIPVRRFCEEQEEGLVGEILPRKRELRFDEMEYALDREAGMACFEQVRKRVKARHRKEVAWRVLYRVIAEDTNYLSPHNGRDSVSISLHHNAGLPFERYFRDIEPIFIDHGGRPHWAKKHNLSASALRGLYADWNVFHSIRKQLDPEGYFMNDHLTKLFH
jgi:FAD/FMN-containing dehydrogenase